MRIGFGLSKNPTHVILVEGPKYLVSVVCKLIRAVIWFKFGQHYSDSRLKSDFTWN